LPPSLFTDPAWTAENSNWRTIEYLHTQMTIILIYEIEETDSGNENDFIEKLKQKIENYINLHKGTSIEHRWRKKNRPASKLIQKLQQTGIVQQKEKE